MQQTVPPTLVPELVGVYSGLAGTSCVHREPGSLTPCCESATHTLIMGTSGGLKHYPVCDKHGQPENLPEKEKEWTGRFYQPGGDSVDV